jgi:hypothetical protein
MASSRDHPETAMRAFSPPSQQTTSADWSIDTYARGSPAPSKAIFGRAVRRSISDAKEAMEPGVGRFAGLDWKVSHVAGGPAGAEVYLESARSIKLLR